ncbi:MAG: 3-isopropylmalate dehydratase small subunit [Rhodospirillaceae bacterium]|nr:3-isopropylmalate dehydratase small subunit [Rhodospirillaceae bacterium]
MTLTMQKFTTLSSVAAPIMRVNIDTDAIIPSREMKGVTKDGLSVGMFANWRYTDVDARVENPDFILNKAQFRDAEILLSGENFGCGSSREHAVWALKEWGIRCVIAPSFGTIFHGNCVRNGILPIVLSEDNVKAFAVVAEQEVDGALFTVDLLAQTVTSPEGDAHAFEIAPADKEMLVEGLDPIGLTLKQDDAILAFREKDMAQRPWVYL